MRRAYGGGRVNPSEQMLADLIAEAARTSDAAHWPDAVAIAMGPVILAAKAEALREAAATFDTRSETLLRTMQNMADSRECEPADIVRYGAYSAESNTTAHWLRARADKLTT